jgi:hypothetical protein
MREVMAAGNPTSLPGFQVKKIKVAAGHPAIPACHPHNPIIRHIFE